MRGLRGRMREKEGRMDESRVKKGKCLTNVHDLAL